MTALEIAQTRSSDNRIKWICLCDCGNITTVLAKDLKKMHTISCGCFHKSLGELTIEKILKENNIPYIAQYRFLDFNQRIYDFAILNDNNEVVRLIEFDGEQHYQDIINWRSCAEEVQQRDKEKNNYALSHNIPLVRIPYWERDNITLFTLLEDDNFLIKKEN